MLQSLSWKRQKLNYQVQVGAIWHPNKPYSITCWQWDKQDTTPITHAYCTLCQTSWPWLPHPSQLLPCEVWRRPAGGKRQRCCAQGLNCVHGADGACEARWISQPSRNCQTWSIVYHLSSRIFKAPFGPLVSSHTWCVWACVFLIDAWWSLKLHSFGRRRIRKLYGRIRKLYGRIRKLWFGNYDSETNTVWFGNYDSETIRSDSETMIRKLYGWIRKLYGLIRKLWFGNYDSETMIRKLYGRIRKLYGQIRKLWFGNYTDWFGNYDSETMIRKLYGWIRKLYGLIRKLWFGNYTVWFGNYVSETIRSDSETILE